MTVSDVQKVIEAWAPQEIAWDKDNVGLQVGSPDAIVRTIFVCLDVTEGTVREAAERGVDLVISHHPLLFRPLRSIDLRTLSGRCVAQLLQSGISLYSAHTNLDFAHGGTSFALAEKLGLMKVDFLLKNYRLTKKIVTFVPPDHVDRVTQAMANAGAGRIGNYEFCSFQTNGAGTFKGNDKSTPTIGTRGKLEHAEEIRLEMIVDQPNIQSVVSAMIHAHPYEEPAYDVYPLESPSREYGMGAIGELARPMVTQRFTRHVMKALSAKTVRSTCPSAIRIRRVAVCGGSGSELTNEAIRQGADAFVTADVKYHSFHGAEGRILLIDAGHYETEQPVVDALAKRLKKEFKRLRTPPRVYTARTSSNPIVYN
jgi:dinuclear metal center YbgI/SA1388 family protein